MGFMAASNFFTSVRDARFTYQRAVEGISCVAGSSELPLFVATDSAELKAALLGRNLSTLLGPVNSAFLAHHHALSRVVAHGCSNCMVNAVHKHNFSSES